MKPAINFIFCLFTITILFNTSCSDSLTGSESDLSDSLVPVEEIQLIPGGENATITVNKNRRGAYFDIHFTNIGSNSVIENDPLESWCIYWTTPIDSNNGIYNGIKLYSTDLVEEWKPLNYLLNISQALKNGDRDLTYRDFQIVLQSLRANPEFSVDNIATEDLPSIFQTEDGERNYSTEKVKQILATVDAVYKDFSFSTGTKFAVIAETPPDVQTVFAVVEKK